MPAPRVEAQAEPVNPTLVRAFQSVPRRRYKDDAEEVPDTRDEELFNNSRTDGIDYSKYEEIEVSIEGNEASDSINTFSGLNLKPQLQRNIDKLGYVDPTPIQKYAVPNAVGKRDIMACAQTGSGKTAAFLIPIIQTILNNPNFKPHSRYKYGERISPLALVLAPTRELCRQIHEEARKFSYRTGVTTCSAYGGQSKDVQLRHMARGCDILVATPGRLNDFLSQRAVTMSKICYLALDEADRMLDMGFQPQIEDIVLYADMPDKTERQTMVFSATFPKEIQRLASSYLEDYIKITVGRVGSTTDLITQDVRYVHKFQKWDMLEDLLPELKQAIIFSQTKSGVDRIEQDLSRKGIRCAAIHGDKSQNQRDRALLNFKQGRSKIMIATDVAARGLDIPNVSHVINFDMPNNIDDYVHRIGRTGRAGKRGTAISFVSDDNMPVVRDLKTLLVESKQEVPDAIERMCLSRQSGMRNGKGRGGKGEGEGEDEAAVDGGEADTIAGGAAGKTIVGVAGGETETTDGELKEVPRGVMDGADTKGMSTELDLVAKKVQTLTLAHKTMVLVKETKVASWQRSRD
eukprot:CAMPEP_0114508248 /NCGR_PEP_ID=MMETSP0109-20121206/12487_1 /TAXON_ID=29199 /ORGANISM="Chlorarachnion reptans, Strain CCCM449" /LENGTH=574 /DNA_ID=CAMNT_0001687145 /DNA_START=84 /DNA_END=1809 /DNA_ORIENTATION=+